MTEITSTPTRKSYTDEQREMYCKLKATYKELTLAIRFLKADRKLSNKTQPKIWADRFNADLIPNLDYLQAMAKAIHIARSLARGRSLSQIIPGHKLAGYEQANIEYWTKAIQDPGSFKLYIYINDSLSKSQQAVQAAHALAEFQKTFPNAPWINGTLVLMTLPEKTENHWGGFRFPFNTEARQKHSLFQTAFKEPDMDNKITAFAILPMNSSHGLSYSKLL